MKLTQSKKVIISDLGNVIMWVERQRTYQCIGEWYGISSSQVKDLINRSGFHYRYELGNFTTEEFHCRITGLFDTGSETMPYDLFTRAWSDIFFRNEAVIQAFHQLKHQASLVMLSNTSDVDFNRVQRLLGDDLNVFEGRLVLSFKEGIAKPDAEIYHRGLQASGLAIDPAQAIFIDDLLENVSGADALGISTCLYQDHQAFIDQMKGFGFEL
jgi:putative hydrolase of the HAD superfamily